MPARTGREFLNGLTEPRDIYVGADKVTDVTDVWTFARDVSSRDPNWKVVATEAGH